MANNFVMPHFSVAGTDANGDATVENQSSGDANESGFFTPNFSGYLSDFNSQKQSDLQKEKDRKDRQAKIDAQNRLKAENKKNGKNEDGTNKTLGQQVAEFGGFLGEAGNNVGNFVVDSIKDPGKRMEQVASAGAQTISEFNGNNAASQKVNDAAVKERMDSRQQLYKQLSATDDPTERDRLKKQIKINDVVGVGEHSYNSAQQQAAIDTDPRQTLVNAGETALDFATGGMGGQLIKQGGKQAIEQGIKNVAKQAAKGAAGGAASGASYGALETARNKDASLSDYVANASIGAAVGGALGGAVGGVATKFGNNKVLSATRDKQSAEVAAKEAELAAKPKQLTAGDTSPTEAQLQLGESASPHDAKIAELDAESQRIRDGDYSGLTTPTKTNPGQRGTTVETADPVAVKAQHEAAVAADTAEQEIKRLNDQKSASPYHRSIDKLDAQKQKELDSLDQMSQDPSLDPQAIESAKADVEARLKPEYDRIAQKYPQDHAEAPALNDSLKNVTLSRMKAEADLQRLVSEQSNATAKLGGVDTIDTPDPKAIMDRLKQIDVEKADAVKAKADVEYRKTTYGSPDDNSIELQKLNDGSFTPETHPEMFNADGSQNTKARIDRVKQLRNDSQTTQNRTTFEDNVPSGGKASKVAESNPEVAQAMESEADNVDSILSDANPNYQPGLLAQASSTARVYAKAGLTKVLNLVRDGHDAMIQDNNAMAKQLHAWSDSIGGDKATTENIGRYLNGESVSLSKEAQVVADEMKTYYHQAAKDLGLQPSEQIKDYFPHMFSDKSLADRLDKYRAIAKDTTASTKDRTVAQKKFEKLQQQFLKTSDPDFQAMLERNPGSKVKMGNLEQRKFDTDGYSYNAFKVIDTYSRRANMKIRMEPGLKALQDSRATVSEDMSTYIAKHMNLIKNNGEARSALTKGIDITLQKAGFKPGAFEKGSDVARTLIYDGTMGLNVGSAIRNSTQLTNTYALAGEKHGAIGLAQAILATKSKAMQKELADAGILNDTLTHALAGTESTFKQGAGAVAENGQKALWAMFNTTEKMNRTASYYAGKSKALAKGASETEAVQAGKDMARKTQFNSSVVDSPVGFSGPMAKNFLQLASFNVKQVEFIKDLVVGSEGFFVKNKNGSYRPTKQGALNLARFTGGSMANLAILGPVVGLTATQMIPFLQEFGNGEIYQSPLVQIVMGKSGSKQGLIGLNSGKDKYGQDASLASNFQDFVGDTAPVVLPAGVQAKKFIDSQQTFDQGYSSSASGNIRFGVDSNDTGARIKGALLGQYTTDQGREYVRNMKNKDENGASIGGSLTASASDKIKSADPSQRPEMITFYQAAKSITGHTGTNDEITKMYQEGRPERARTMAKDYNAKVDEKMAPYYAKYPDMDQDLVDELNKNLYIKITVRGEKQRASL